MWRWIRNPVTAGAAANLGVVVVATFVVAVVGLVVEDLLPKRDPNAMAVWARWISVAVGLVVLFVALYLRGRMRRTAGTLFHVQILDEAFEDLRGVGTAQARERKLASRSITRWVDLRHRRNSSGTIELVDVCEQVGSAVEAQINNDTSDTGYTVAPNMLWPMALAVGSSLSLPNKLQLLELPTKRDPMIEVPLLHEPLAVRVTSVGKLAKAKRVGVWLAFSSASQHYAWDELMPQFGVGAGRIIHLGEPPVKGRLPEPLTEEQMAGLGPAIAAELVDFKNALDEATELLVVAMITKVAALSAGWHIAQQGCRFFANTYLMHYDGHAFVAMRVKESQPTMAPQHA